ncbi:MAG: hypothetical protein KAS89_00990 [Candidatus Eisenbacteria sp.]|nr:hypothetical protein [Candidatus Eisenbacteria bacterium]
MRLFVKKIDLNPDTGDILMHLFGRPPLRASKQTPASGETGVRIGLVAGARFGADSDRVPIVTAHWRYSGIKHAQRKLTRIGLVG